MLPPLAMDNNVPISLLLFIILRMLLQKYRSPQAIARFQMEDEIIHRLNLVLVNKLQKSGRKTLPKCLKQLERAFNHNFTSH